MDRKQKANLLRSRALMGNQNARKKAATVPGAASAETAASATAPTSTTALSPERQEGPHPYECCESLGSGYCCCGLYDNYECALWGDQEVPD